MPSSHSLTRLFSPDHGAASATRVLNLYTAAGELAQDQLTMILAPGSALLVMSGLAAATRRRRR
ncbi:MAG: hypothetical protein U0640_01940 [Phycisphaerales bacterium]